MANYFVFNRMTGKILRHGTCSQGDMLLQAGPGEAVMGGIADELRQKVVDWRLVDRTPEEIEASQPKAPKEEEMPARITQGDLAALMARLGALEAKLKGVKE